MKNSDGKESNMAKGVNIATEFNEFKDTLLNKKQSGTKSKEFKVKNIKLEHTKSTQYHYRVLVIRFVLDDGIYTLPYFPKDFKNRFSQMIIDILTDKNKCTQIRISVDK